MEVPLYSAFCVRMAQGEEEEEETISGRQWWLITSLPLNAACSHLTGKLEEKAESVWDEYSSPHVY